MLLWFVLFVVFAVLGIYSLAQRRREHQPRTGRTNNQMAVPYVSVIHATPLNVDSDIGAAGDPQAYVESPIYARTNGYLKKWYKDIGSHVKKGDLLAEIDTPEVDQQLAQARADLVTAQANLSSVRHHRHALSGLDQDRFRFQAGSGQLRTATSPPSKPWCNRPRPT